MSYTIEVLTEKQDLGYFWCILDENRCNSGFGYGATMDLAFQAAKEYLAKIS